MNTTTPYAWRDKFQIPEKNMREWKQTAPEKSLTFYALKNRIINEKDYFDWAVDYYQIPKVNNLYFEQKLIKQDEWNEIKETYDWTEEVLPIAFWNHTIFIGCLELNDKVPKKVLGFDSRVVLVSQKQLEITWSFFNTLSDIIEKTSTGFNLNPLKLDLEETSKLKKKEESLNTLKLSKETSFKEESPHKLKTEQLKGTFEPDIPNKNKLYPHQPVLKQASRREFPEEDVLRRSQSDETFPGRSLPSEGQHLFMKKQKEKESPFEKNKELLVDKKENKLKLEENSNPYVKNPFKPSVLSKVNQPKLEKDTETTNFLNLTEKENYISLWNYTKKYYCSSILFNVKADKAYLDSFVGRVSLKSSIDKIYVDFKDHTFFKVIQRGYPYNGFVVESPANKKFFADLGWDKYPQYTTGIPIKDSSENIKKIFVGFSLKSFSKQEIQNIQKDILDIFKEKKLSQAA